MMLPMLLPHETYYCSKPHFDFEDRSKSNFGHPDSLETELMSEHLDKLILGKNIPLPIYDFSTHLRSKKTKTIHPRPILIIDGILVLHEKRLRERMDLKIFIDVDADLGLLRRLERDIKERNMEVPSVLNQFLKTVRPMHEMYVEPSRRYADIFIPVGRHNHKSVQLLLNLLRLMLHNPTKQICNILSETSIPLEFH